MAPAYGGRVVNAPSLFPHAARQTRLRLAAHWLHEAERPVCIAGRGVVWSGASPDLLRLCDSLPRLRVASTPAAKGVFPESDPRALGVWGFSGHEAATKGVEQADVLLVIGTRLHEPSSASWHPRLAAPRVIRIDLDPSRMSTTRDQHITLVGDSGVLLESIRGAVAKLPATTLQMAAAGTGIPRFRGPTRAGRWVKPQSLFDVLNRVAATVPICADAGNSMCWAIEWLERSMPRQFHVSVDWGTMGFALPAALGTLLARPPAPAIAITGDGSLAMAGGELHTAVELEVPLLVIALNDGGAGMVRAGSEAWFGRGQVPDTDYRHRMDLAAFARALGAHAESVTSTEQFEAMLLEALARTTPTLLDVHVDPGEVPQAVRARVHGLAESPREGGGIC